MKKKSWIILLIVVLALAYPVGKYMKEVYLPAIKPQSSTGNLAPEEYFTDLDGNEYKLSDFTNQGKPVVMNFWAVDCPPCVKELPHFEEVYPKYKDDVIFLMVNCVDGSRDTVESASTYIAEMGYTFPVYYDVTYSAADSYNVAEYPETVFITRDGYINGTFSGSIPVSNLEEGIRALLK